MKKLLLMTAMFIMSLAVTAQTYEFPRQSPNSKRLKVTKVVRSSESTIVYLRYTIPEESTTGWSMIEAYPLLIDEATGKKYQATGALNFKWNQKYTKTATYKIEFPPLPKTTSVVTFREASNVKGAFVVSNIALPIQNKQATTNRPAANNNSSSSNNPKVYDKQKLLKEGYKFSWDEPRQSIYNKYFKVTKVIRSNKNTIVHLRYTGQNSLKSDYIRFYDDDTDKEFKITNYLNCLWYESQTPPFTFKIELEAIPLNTSSLSIKVNKKIVIENIKVPIRTR